MRNQSADTIVYGIVYTNSRPYFQSTYPLMNDRYVYEALSLNLMKFVYLPPFFSFF